MQTSPFSKMLQLMDARYPRYAELWRTSRRDFGDEWLNEFETSVTALFEDGAGWDEAVDGYAEFCTDALRSQIYFEKSRQYKATSYKDVARQCYHNAAFMFRSYLPGMFISHFIWPHHYRLLRYFRDVLRVIPTGRTFADVGTGCGMYSKEPLAVWPGVHGSGYDISQHALSFTRRVVGAFGFADRYELHEQNILETPPAAVDLVICQEVLEHLEDPAEFIVGLYAMTKPGGHAYISGAINAGHIDHIYLYKNPGEVEDQLLRAGFHVVDSRAEYAYAGKLIELTPCVAAFLCARTA